MLIPNIDVQAARAVAVFAPDALLGVKGVPEITGQFIVTRRAGLGPRPLGTRDFRVLREGAGPIVGFLFCRKGTNTA
jgi:hypothetical protein